MLGGEQSALGAGLHASSSRRRPDARELMSRMCLAGFTLNRVGTVEGQHYTQTTAHVG